MSPSQDSSTSTTDQPSSFRISVATASPDQTMALGASLAEVLRVGDLVVLTGDLGAGKTKLVQGVGAGMGIAESITSPTFALANRYPMAAETDKFLHHLDVYRLNVVGEAADLDIPDLVDSGIVMIEWGGQIDAVLPADRLEVSIEFPSTDSDDELRRLVFTAMGDQWHRRAAELGAALEPWVQATS